LDGSITHPAATTYAPMASKTPLVAAKNREVIKHSKYDLIAVNEKSSFVPFVMETFGGFGGEALNFLKQISRCHSELTPTPSPTGAFKTLVSRALSVCLQRGNALVQSYGCRHARMHAGVQVGFALP